MIILRRNKKIVELYPIGPAKGALNSKRKPLFYSYFKLYEDDGKIRPYRFIIRQDNVETIKMPKDAIKIMRKQNVLLATKDENIEKMLNSLNIPFKYTHICRHCTFSGNITLINKSHSYKLYDEYICKSCAEEEILRVMELKGYKKAVFPSFKKLLHKTHDLERVLNIFNPKFNPVKEEELTLYDTITVKKEKYPKINVKSLKIPNKFKQMLSKKVKYLLPVQILALNAGLLENQNMLVVSATASGKTLVGELAGIPKALQHKKFIYLTPLVALANQKYRDFKKQYGPLGLKVAIKVGSNRVKAKNELTISNKSVKDADIVVATYEGLDFLLRSGNYGQLSNIGTVVIDEIHMLDEQERGPRLNGLVNRLITIFPKAQLIGLSATVKNSKQIANNFKMKLVQYDQRPVPLERHLIFTKNEFEKNSLLAKFSKKEFNTKSSKGYHGQTIIFTNSRRKTHTISQQIQKRGVTSAAYHAGLSYSKKVKIEKDFADQKIATVVTTAALAAGVDFPAAQVLFETLRMGNKWLTNNDFSQMLGRAGRPSYHDRGKVILLPEIGKEYDNESEEEMAVKLLDSDVDDIVVEYSQEDSYEQVLADICAIKNSDVRNLESKYNKLDSPLLFDEVLEVLLEKKLITSKNDNESVLLPTRYGRAVSMSFLDIVKADYIKKHITQDPLLTVETIESFESAYLSNRLISRVSKAMKTNVSTRLFADSTLVILTTGDLLAKLDPQYVDKILAIQVDFMDCKCKERPFCKCLEKNISHHILKRRLQGWNPNRISKEFMSLYDIHIYPGDIFTWLDQAIRTLEAISRIAKAFNNKKVNVNCNRLIKKIERGH